MGAFSVASRNCRTIVLNVKEILWKNNFCAMYSFIRMFLLQLLSSTLVAHKHKHRRFCNCTSFVFMSSQCIAMKEKTNGEACSLLLL